MASRSRQKAIHRFCPLTGLSLILFLALTSASGTASENAAPTAAERGYRLLVDKAFLPPDFDQATFDLLWTVWPDDLKKLAKESSLQHRRQLAYSRYGLTPRPDDPTKPLQYVVDKAGNWVMNCFACHGGKLMGKPILGLPNSHVALETLTSDVRKVKLRLEKPLTHMQVGSLVMPLGKTNGTTNAVMFGVALMSLRDADLNLHMDRRPPSMVHHDMDAPAWWQFKRKTHLYIDAFAEKGHRDLMQFMLVPENGPEDFRDWENDFRDVYAFIESLEAPQYPFDIDQALARQGKIAFTSHCAECHGSYGRDDSYPNKVIDIDVVGTDRVRFDALNGDNHRLYHRSWFANHGQQDTHFDTGGYIAPPLDGIWASAPYFHNGSVPTLWHVLHSTKRPVVWRRTEDGFDRQRVGLEVAEFDRLPPHLRELSEVRKYFHTRRFGKSAAGHTFPDELTADAKLAVLEYLKTL